MFILVLIVGLFLIVGCIYFTRKKGFTDTTTVFFIGLSTIFYITLAYLKIIEVFQKLML